MPDIQHCAPESSADDSDEDALLSSRASAINLRVAELAKRAVESSGPMVVQGGVSAQVKRDMEREVITPSLHRGVSCGTGAQ